MQGKSNNLDHPIFDRTARVSGREHEAALPVPRVTTDRLMRGCREIVVQHGCVDYRLRITATGKLILTK
jgi:hemin uptake protein HemP